MKKYYLVDDTTNSKSDMDVKVFDSLDEAIEQGAKDWGCLTDSEKEQRVAFYTAVGEPTEEEEREFLLPEAGVKVVKDYKWSDSVSDITSVSLMYAEDNTYNYIIVQDRDLNREIVIDIDVSDDEIEVCKTHENDLEWINDKITETIQQGGLGWITTNRTEYIVYRHI